ncbi:ISAs1 family transposase [Candidatus Methylobacter oryzae]|uniref:ISAs1 family transposase n=1 Tax=Candidatus Methylobacter oryzae TaxID=2497749 RepID=A0ABY3CC81_9GAMM|nr:ISAs1 family transposase [Candidatus Methylobacter oryzae]TRW98099.1 ISAs1 family transposase [Candidatus Methylobacter oryzae]
MALSLQEAFSSLEDPRLERHKRHKLLDIIVLTICAVISGAEGWEAIEQFGENKQDWLRKWIELENGIPSHDCIARVIARIDPAKLSECFIAWGQSVAELSLGEVVAIDGKTARRSYHGKDKLGAIHRGSAWASQAGLSLGPVKTDAKSNEITAIPVLLEMLEINGCIVTLDAMGCQTDIAEKVIEKKADYVLAVKDNQKRLHEAISDYFEVAVATDRPELCQLQSHSETNAEHGRIEIRRSYLSTCLDTLPDAARWKGLKSIGMVESERTVNGKTSIECRHYLSTLDDVKAFASAARAHWGIENSLHWVLDVTFREDDSRIRTGYAPENFNVVRQLAINLLKKEPSKMSIKKKRFKAALNDDFRESIIFPA